MVQVDNDEFLKQLKTLFEASQTSGSVFITQKRCTYNFAGTTGDDTSTTMQASTSSSSSAAVTTEYPMVIKASNGKHPAHRIKLSTIVQPEKHGEFLTGYTSLLKSSFSAGLRKKDNKKKKDAAKRAAALKAASSSKSVSSSSSSRKASTTTPSAVNASSASFAKIPKVSGPKRGAGHAKRQRSERARSKAIKRIMLARKKRMAAGRFLTRLATRAVGEATAERLQAAQ